MEQAELTVLFDPLNNEVHVPVKFQQVLLLDECIDKDISLVVLKPAMVILPNDMDTTMYHARLVGWEMTMLLKSERNDGFWMVSECILDTGSVLLKQLMLEGQVVTFQGS